MESMSRATWTDERLDGFAHNVDRRFDEVDRRFDGIDRRLDRVESELRELRTHMMLLQRTMLLFGGGTIFTVVFGFLGIILTRA